MLRHLMVGVVSHLSSPIPGWAEGRRLRIQFFGKLRSFMVTTEHNSIEGCFFFFFSHKLMAQNNAIFDIIHRSLVLTPDPLNKNKKKLFLLISSCSFYFTATKRRVVNTLNQDLVYNAASYAETHISCAS